MRTVEVAIVGAGVIGLSIAVHLRERGAEPVLLLDRAGIGAGASGVQPGGVRRQWSTRGHCLLAQESYGYYLELADRLQPAAEPVLEPCGYLFTAHSEEALGRLAANVSLQNELGIPSEVIEPGRVAELVPGLDPSSLTGAAWCGTDGYFDKPQGVVEGFAEAAVRLGAEVRLADVRALDPEGSAWRLELSGGEHVSASNVVVAAGCDSPALLAPLGVELPIEREPRYVFMSAPIRERLLEPLVISSERHFAAKQLANGRVIASDLRANGDPEQERQAWRATVRAGVEELTPMLSFVAFDLLVDGIYDTTPDHTEILGPVGGRAGLWLAAGFSGHGFMMAPAVGRSLADWIAGGDPGEPATEFTLERFAAGELGIETQVV
jgi:sarcosine oxidase subunit beta